MSRRQPLLGMFHELKESGSTFDWPLLLANVMYKVLLDKFQGVNSPWKSYTYQSDLADFKTAKRVILNEAPDLLKIAEDGVYTDSKIGDNGYGIALDTYGRTFSVGRKAIINDDLEGIKRQPARQGRAAGRTIAKTIVAQIEGDGKTYDGISLFSLAHKNSGNTTLATTGAGIQAVSDAMTAIEVATDETGEKMGLSAKYLVVPPQLKDIAMRITSGQGFTPVNTDGGVQVMGKAQTLQVLSEPFFTSTTGWYVMADPNDCPVIEVGLLDGKDTPDLLVKRADTISLAGGEDQWGYDFDEIFYKVRWDWALARGMYQGIYRGKA